MAIGVVALMLSACSMGSMICRSTEGGDAPGDAGSPAEIRKRHRSYHARRERMA